ncbi:hypothetical protein [Actinomadura litoris]|uniref:hypothetical protein n=1 Tax=Actinomadura litoris TaxID=2678616 RepID=UPI001FA6BD33|nr:hypothetical protein [Actinomadura litoris]
MTAPDRPAETRQDARPAGPADLLALAAAWEDKASLIRATSREVDDRGDGMHLAGQATGLMDAAVQLRNLLADSAALNETERS